MANSSNIADALEEEIDRLKRIKRTKDMALQMLKSTSTGIMPKYSKSSTEPGFLQHWMQFHAAIEFLTDHGYLTRVGGTPKSGPRYEATAKGLAYLKRNYKD